MKTKTNTVKWCAPIKINDAGDLAYTSQCGRYTITKGHWYDPRIANTKAGGLRASYGITVNATGYTHGCNGLAGGREWAEQLALTAAEQAYEAAVKAAAASYAALAVAADEAAAAAYAAAEAALDVDANVSSAWCTTGDALAALATDYEAAAAWAAAGCIANALTGLTAAEAKRAAAAD